MIDLQDENQVESYIEFVKQVTSDKDFVVLSIHWGPNWGYDIDPKFSQFAHSLLDRTSVRVIHGHSSHHFKGIEQYKQKLIFYGCGDFINDYETIIDPAHDHFMPNIVLAYYLSFDKKFDLVSLEIEIYRIHNFQLNEPVNWTMIRLNVG